MGPGDIFEGSYRIDREVGRGSFGIVYRAVELSSGREVALKILLPWTKTMPALRHRLEREAKLTRMLTSPHAIRIEDLKESADGDLYIVMEYLTGQELVELLGGSKRIEPPRATEIALQVLDALGEAHRLGIIHRDLKPHNIFICPVADGRDLVKVLDFGIAKVAGTEGGGGLKETTRLTVAGSILGTPVYMSPEQCRGEDLTPASDFYSLSVVLYEMLTGRVPFDDKNPVRVMMMHANNPPPPLPPALASTLLGKAIMRGLEKEQSDRFQNAEEFATAIRGREVSDEPPASGQPEPRRPSAGPNQPFAEMPTPATPIMLPRQAAQQFASGAIAAESGPARPVRQRTSGRLSVSAVAIAILILAIAGIGFFLLRDGI